MLGIRFNSSGLLKSQNNFLTFVYTRLLTLHSTGSGFQASCNKRQGFPKCQIYNEVKERKRCAYFSVTVKMEIQQNKCKGKLVSDITCTVSNNTHTQCNILVITGEVSAAGIAFLFKS